MDNQFLVFLKFDILQVTHFTNRMTYSVVLHERAAVTTTGFSFINHKHPDRNTSSGL